MFKTASILVDKIGNCLGPEVLDLRQVFRSVRLECLEQNVQKDAVIAGEVPFNSDEYPALDENLQNFYIATVLKMPEKAIIFTDWDMVWPNYYIAHILESRHDFTFVETYPAEDVYSVAASVVDYMAINWADHPIFYGEREQTLLNAGFDFTPARLGLARLFRVITNE